MDTVKLEFQAPKNKSIEYNGAIISLKPYLSINEQVVLINYYLSTYFSLGEDGKVSLVDNAPYRMLEAEYNLIHSIFSLITNVDSVSLDTDMYDATELWKEVRNSILNYKEFRNTLDTIVKDIKEDRELKLSTGYVLKDLTDKAYDVLDAFSKFTPDDVDKLKNSTSELLKQLDNSNIAPAIKAPKAKKAKI